MKQIIICIVFLLSSLNSKASDIDKLKSKITLDNGITWYSFTNLEVLSKHFLLRIDDKGKVTTHLSKPFVKKEFLNYIDFINQFHIVNLTNPVSSAQSKII